MDIIKNVVGSNIDIEDSNGDKIVDVGLLGDTSQDGTPTPTAPQPINIVSGRQDVVVCGKNLCSGTELGFYNSSGIKTTGTYLVNKDLIPVSPSTNYKISNNGSGFAVNVLKYSQTGEYLGTTQFSGTQSIAIPSDTYYINFWRANNLGTDLKIQLEKGNTISEYEAYKGNTYEINLGKNLLETKEGVYTRSTTHTWNVSNDNILVSVNDANVQGGSLNINTGQVGVWGGTYKSDNHITSNGGTYTLSIEAMGNINLGRTTGFLGLYYHIYNDDGTTAQTEVKFTANATTTKTITLNSNQHLGSIVLYSQYISCENVELKIQVEKGSEATTYVPYKTPIELCKIGNYQDRIFKSSGKNLIPFSDIISTGGTTSNGITFTLQADGTIKANGTATAGVSIYLTTNYIEQTAGTYTFSDGIASGQSGTTFFLYADVRHLDGTSWDTKNFSTAETTTRTRTIEEAFKFKPRIVIRQGQILTDLIFKPQLELGNQATSYEPYGSGTWYLEKNIGKVVLNGSENWRKSSKTQVNRYYVTNIFNTISNTNSIDLISNYFVCITPSSSDGNQIGLAKFNDNGLMNNIPLSNTDLDTLEKYKTWLNTHNTTVYYVLATPTYTEITDSELISQLNALEQAQVPYGIAHINVSGDLPTILDLDYYTLDRYITPEDRQALLDGSATIPFRINIIKDGEVIKTLDEYSIVELDYEDFRYVDSESIVIGQFVARKVIGKLDQIYTEFEIEDTELEVQIGVSYNNNTTYYSLGNFLVIKPTTDDVKEKTEFEAMDYTKKFNKKFDDTNLIFPCTALELAQYTCDLCGVELGTTSFANDDFIIQDNQYVEGDTCRKVMQDIGKLAYSWVRIDWDNKCYIDFDTKDSIIDYNRITNTEYYDLSLQREVLGPVNRVVIGIRDVDGENAVIEDSDSIEEYGVTEIQLYDNNLTYTPELRLQAIQAATRLFGLTYLPLETNTIGHPWLIGNERIEVKDMNDNLLYTYPWDRTIAYNGHIKSKLVSKADTKTETEYRNYGDLETATRQTRIIVDKQNQTIEALAEAVQPISNEISNVGSITLENAYEGTLHRLEIKGSISALFPSTTLYPSTTSYPLTPTLKVDDTLYVLGFTTLRYINSSTCDLYVYEDGKQWVERNIGVDGGGNLYELPDNEKYIEELPDITIQVSSSSVISLDGFANANLKALYLLENDYTDTFATNVDLVSKINISPSNIAIQSHKIALEGYTTINGNFWVDLEGNMHARSGSFEGNIMLPNGGRVIGGDGLFSCLAYTSTGRFSNWDIIGFGTSGANVSDTDVRYADIFVNAYIPENFTITCAYAILEVTSVNSSYTDASGDYEVVGTPKDIGLLVGVGGTSVTFFYYPYQAVDEEVEYSGTEIPNAFGNGRYTPSINSPGSVEEAKSIDIKDYLTIGEMNTIFVRSLLSPKPVVKTFTPSGGSYTMYNYEELVRNTGVGRLNLFVFGYMSTDAEE